MVTPSPFDPSAALRASFLSLRENCADGSVKRKELFYQIPRLRCATLGMTVVLHAHRILGFVRRFQILDA